MEGPEEAIYRVDGSVYSGSNDSVEAPSGVCHVRAYGSIAAMVPLVLKGDWIRVGTYHSYVASTQTDFSIWYCVIVTFRIVHIANCISMYIRI